MRTLLIPTPLLRLSCFAIVLALMTSHHAASAANAGAQVWGAPAGGYQLSIHLNSPAAGVGTPVVVYITVKNVGRSNLEYWYWDLDRYITVDVRNLRGGAIPLTRYWALHMALPKASIEGISTDFTSQRLKPGEAAKYTYLANQICDMSIPSSYRITVTLAAYRSVMPHQGPEGHVIVTSNTAPLQISDFAPDAPEYQPAQADAPSDGDSHKTRREYGLK